MQDQDKEYIVNMGFQDGDTGRMYNSGQTLTQMEYNLLKMQYKVRCSENFRIGGDREGGNDLFPRA